ncbi:hypothetical protein HXX76_015941 [Chlamydomonas incerta]|uniref:DNA polymerase delta small subunit n=1 Tax=Chlamydomonas incerta TaxID=51695 RepID=A0A835VR96_CHLIN|nr:hypothetical protein HXX76_015941 [Chlamydomonas incerta]|eukprot:KAG2422561.1 hypothetical protein HXX76_015941 [Chlamydomonas incerta]
MDIERPLPGHTSRYDELLAPSTSKGDEASFNRESASYTNLDGRFRASKRTYERQYAQLYFSRLMLLKNVMRNRVEQLWPGMPVCSILEVQEGKEVAVIGTIYKNMKLKPSILDEYTKDRGLKAALGAANFCADDDGVVMEDDGARMVLSVATPGTMAAAAVELPGWAPGDGPLAVQELVTGLVLAVRGVHEPGGDFFVSAVAFAGLAPNPGPLPHPLPLPLPAAPSADAAAAIAAARPGDKYLALVSGLGLGGGRADMLATQLAAEWLGGSLGSPAEQQLAAQVVRLVVAGGGLGQLEGLAGAAATAPGANPYNRSAQVVALQPVRDLDLLLAELAAALPVDVMPGAEDPANVALPQQPMHRCLFPAAAAHGSLVRATNPHEFECGGVRLLGTSGQNVDDVAKYCGLRDRLDLMQRTLACRHLAPTAPDTLTCYPFTDDDPFILASTPHVYFVGNQPEFATRLVVLQHGCSSSGAAGSSTAAAAGAAAPEAGAAGGSGGGGQPVVVRLVAVPSFARSGTLVLLNLRTLACHPVRFDGSLGMGV